MKIVKDENLSLKAKGMYLMINELVTNNETIGLKRIKEFVTDGETAIRGAINELIENGYIEREMIRINGKIRGIEYRVKK